MTSFIFVKQMMFLFNLLVLMGGSTLVAMGTWVAVDGSPFLYLLGVFSNEPLRFINVGFFCISIGGVLVLLGLLGCGAARKESRCLLLGFFSIILIVFMAELAAGVVVLAYSSFAEKVLDDWATPSLESQYGSDPTISTMWNITMSELNCCGFTNFTDFEGSFFSKQNQGNLPASCCGNNIAPCSPAEAARTTVQGCLHPVLQILKSNADTVGAITAGICALEVAAMIVSMFLYSRAS